jgi:hypothetical protein
MRLVAALAGPLVFSGCAAISYWSTGSTQVVEFVSDPPGATVTLDPRIYPKPLVTPATIQLSRWVSKAEPWGLSAKFPGHEPYLGELFSNRDESIAPLRFLDLAVLLPLLVDVPLFDVAHHSEDLRVWPVSVKFRLAPIGGKSSVMLTWPSPAQ